MSYAEWKELGLRAIALISHEPPPAQIFTWLFLVFLALMVLEGLRANFLPARPGHGGLSRPSKTSALASPERGSKPDATVSDVASTRRPVPQLRNLKRQVAAVRRTKAFRPGIRRNPNDTDWRDYSAPATVQTPQTEMLQPGAPILFEPMEQQYTPH